MVRVFRDFRAQAITLRSQHSSERSSAAAGVTPAPRFRFARTRPGVPDGCCCCCCNYETEAPAPLPYETTSVLGAKHSGCHVNTNSPEVSTVHERSRLHMILSKPATINYYPLTMPKPSCLVAQSVTLIHHVVNALARRIHNFCAEITARHEPDKKKDTSKEGKKTRWIGNKQKKTKGRTTAKILLVPNIQEVTPTRTVRKSTLCATVMWSGRDGVLCRQQSKQKRRKQKTKEKKREKKRKNGECGTQKLNKANVDTVPPTHARVSRLFLH